MLPPPRPSEQSQQSRRSSVDVSGDWQQTHAPGHGASPPKQNDIVLLEESDLYRYEDAGLVLQDLGASYYQPKTSLTTVAMSPPEPAKYTRSMYSYRSHRSAGGAPSNYAPHLTPHVASTKRTASIDTIPAHYGALRPGGPVNLFTKDYIGLLLNWTIVGFFNGSIAGLATPLFKFYLGYSPSQMTATSTLFNFGWYFKFIFGFISDNYAINRQRRKPYMFIGYTVFIGFMIAMTFMNKVAWYGPSKDDIRNANAPNEGVRYVVSIIVSSFAYLLVTVACEGMMVEFAHREGEYDRGRTMLWCLAFRFMGETSGGVYTTLGLASKAYGGTFARAVPLSWFFASLALVAFIGIVVTHCFVRDEQLPSASQRFGSNMRRVWCFLEQRVTTQVMVALFLLSLAINAMVVEWTSIINIWLKADSLAVGLVSVLQSAGYLFAAASLYFWFLNTNWRVMIVVGFSVAAMIQLPIELLTVWNVVRNTALYLTKDCVAGIFEAIAWIIRVMIVVEASEPGLESTTYGFLTTVCNLASAMLSSSYSIVATTWSKSSTDLTTDSDQVRWHVTYEFIVKYGMRFALAFLACLILPRQKRHLKEIKIRGAPNLVVPVALTVVVSLLFAAAITSALMAMFESTMCLPFAGGEGCGKPTSG